MRAVDTNVLVYAHRVEPAEHRRAVEVLTSLVTGTEPCVLPWPCVYEFLRVVTHARVFQPPTPMREAVAAVEALLDSPSVVPVSEGSRHRQIMADLLRESSVTGSAVHDAHIAALLLEHGVDEILTADAGFRHFPQLKIQTRSGPEAAKIMLCL